MNHSPKMQTTMRWAMRSLAGFVVFLLGLTGYGIAAGFLISAVLKPFFPSNVGLWTSTLPASLHIGFESSPPPTTRELLGWWIIPVGLVAGAGFFLLTTLLLRRMLRFMKRPRALPDATR